MISNETVERLHESLTGRTLLPACPNHVLEASEEAGIVLLQCPNCSFFAWVHPEQYKAWLRIPRAD